MMLLDSSGIWGTGIIVIDSSGVYYSIVYTRTVDLHSNYICLLCTLCHS